MASEKAANDVNPNGVYLVYDKSGDRNESDMVGQLPNVLYINGMPHKEGKDRMFICVMSKSFYDDNTPEDLLEKYNIVLRKFRPYSNDKVKEGSTYGFYVTSEGEYSLLCQGLIDVFKHFEETNFIKKDSYEIIFPQPYPDGNPRKYVAVSFKKNEAGTYPKSYIRKLKFILNGSVWNGNKFKIDWLSVNVLRDIRKGTSKEKKETK